MSLICTICKNSVPEGFSHCLVCNAGHVPQLQCGKCATLVNRGSSTCSCDQIIRRMASAASELPDLPLYQPPQQTQSQQTSSSTELTQRVAESFSGGEVVGFQSPISAPSVLPGLPAHVSVAVIPKEYEAGRYGVSATVTIPEKDVGVMNDWAQLVVLLHTMAKRGNEFQGHTEHTRRVIRAMRDLASDIQDEIEMRTGPPR